MIVAIIQARMSSSRLLRKMARLIAGRPMLDWVVRRAQQIPEVSEVLVATSTEHEDLWIVEECYALEVPCVRGPLEDVLTRYEQAAQARSLSSSDLIVRLTGDCPALDPEVSSRVLQAHQQARVDYTANLRDWPDGLDTEVFSRAVLRDADRLATDPEDREHVTPWMRRNVFCQEVPHDPPLRHLKCSVDTEEDLEYVRALYARLGPDFGWEAVGRVTQHAAELPRQTVGAPSPGAGTPRNPGGDRSSRPNAGGR